MNDKSSKIRRILIADDEIRICRLIQKLIKWDELKLVCVGTANNGESALSLIKSEKPDIVLTDIRMPIINGMELIREIKNLDSSTDIIVISGFKEFEYAHTALQYGVNDYLLKPVNGPELNSVLKKIIDKRKTAEDTIEEQNRKDRLLDTSEQIIKENFLRSLINSSGDSSEPVHQEKGFTLSAPKYLAAIIKLDYRQDLSHPEELEKVIIEKSTSLLQKELSLVSEELVFCGKLYGYIYSIINMKEEDIPALNKVLKNLPPILNEHLQTYESVKVTVGCSDIHGSFSEMRYCIAESYQAIQNRYRLGTNRLIVFSQVNDLTAKSASDFIAPYLNDFYNSIDTFSASDLSQVINHIYSPLITDPNMDCFVCTDIAVFLAENFLKRITLNEANAADIGKRLRRSIFYADSIAALKEVLRSELGSLLDEYKLTAQNMQKKPVRLACEYIDLHFHEKISLEDLAGLVDLNPSYFSSLFKKETGLNFSTYLLNTRMEKAKGLLKEGNETIAAVAEKVGYKDTRFFSQTFAKEVGIKPAVYRKLHA